MDKRRLLGRCGSDNSGGSFLINGIEFRLVNIFRLSPESLLPESLLPEELTLTELLLLIGRESEEAFSLSSEPPKFCADLGLVIVLRRIAAFLPKDVSVALRIIPNPGRGFPALAPTVTLRFCFG
mmetsp:Transcript_8820/g.12626  ORF Transcript_8820/g.12626 Transcript_8820/m.12626 type:complete len:125 (+) Transcript_8820:508-882(+)